MWNLEEVPSLSSSKRNYRPSKDFYFSERTPLYYISSTVGRSCGSCDAIKHLEHFSAFHLEWSNITARANVFCRVLPLKKLLDMPLATKPSAAAHSKTAPRSPRQLSSKSEDSQRPLIRNHKKWCAASKGPLTWLLCKKSTSPSAPVQSQCAPSREGNCKMRLITQSSEEVGSLQVACLQQS